MVLSPSQVDHLTHNGGLQVNCIERNLAGHRECTNYPPFEFLRGLRDVTLRRRLISPRFLMCRFRCVSELLIVETKDKMHLYMHLCTYGGRRSATKEIVTRINAAVFELLGSVLCGCVPGAIRNEHIPHIYAFIW